MCLLWPLSPLLYHSGHICSPEGLCDELWTPCAHVIKLRWSQPMVEACATQGSIFSFNASINRILNISVCFFIPWTTNVFLFFFSVSQQMMNDHEEASPDSCIKKVGLLYLFIPLWILSLNLFLSCITTILLCSPTHQTYQSHWDCEVIKWQFIASTKSRTSYQFTW